MTHHRTYVAPHLEQDDLFAVPPPARGAPLLAHIVCAVCEKPCQIPILADGKLCDHCRRDLDATQAHVAETLRLAQARRNDLGTVYEATWAQADDTVRDQLDRILAQREAQNFANRLAKARRLPDWGAALTLWERRVAFDQAAVNLDRVRGWAEGAQEELREVRDVDVR